MRFRNCLSFICFFLSTIQNINDCYPALFGKRIDEEGGRHEESEGDNDEFSKHFGWIYNAKLVSEFESIPIKQVWDLSVVHFLNDLLYIKLKQQRDANQYRSSAAKVF